jgi:hypothetical protein
VSSDERLDAALNGMIDEGYRLVWQAPLVVDGAPGRDFLMQDAADATWTRLRVVVNGADLYMLQAAATSKEGLLDESVPRFMASLRWY